VCICVVCNSDSELRSNFFLTEVNDRVTETYSSALLAMSLSYYYVMGEHLRKEDSERVDEIVSSLLTMFGSKAYANPRTPSASEFVFVCTHIY